MGLFTRLSHLVVRVNDLDTMVAFYRDVLGLTVTHQQGGNAFLSSDPTAEDHEIGLFSGRDAGDSNLLVHHCWRVATVADLKTLYDRLKELGVPIRGGVSHAYPWSGEAAVSCSFLDPEGNHVEVQARVENLDCEIEDRSLRDLDLEQSVEEIIAQAQRRVPSAAAPASAGVFPLSPTLPREGGGSAATARW